MKILGIDPGIAGAVAVIEIVDGVDGIAPKLLGVTDIPTLGTAAKIRVDAIELRDWIEVYRPDFAGVERAGSMPRQGVASAFKYGRAAGVIEAVVACCGMATAKRTKQSDRSPTSTRKKTPPSTSSKPCALA
jgi:Holliday junction resolvasome RuvABC endonuclease subunit